MTVESITPAGVVTPLNRIVPTFEKGGELSSISIGSEWPQDTLDLESAFPNPIPEGMMCKPEYRVVNIKGRQVARLILTPILPAHPVLKAGTVDLSKMDVPALLTYCAEKDIPIVRKATVEKPHTKTEILDVIAKAAK